MGYFWKLIKCDFCILVLYFSSFSASDNGNALRNQTLVDKLRQDLLRYYDIFVRPSTDNHPTDVNIKLKVRTVNLDYDTSIFTINGWLVMDWLDYKLAWNSSEYNGLKQVHLAHHEIWKPDIIAYNSIATDTANRYEGMNLIVNSTGRVLWMPSTTYKVYCNFDISLWPYDTQHCSLILNSLTYDSSFVNINANKANIMQSDATYGWKILNVDSKRSEITSICCPEPYVTIEYIFHVEKFHHLFHSFIILPALGTSILLLSAFWLIPEQIEKFLIIGLVGVTSCIFLIFYSVKVPVLIHQTPDIIKFYISIVCMSMIYLILSVVLYNISSTSITSKKKPPDCLCKFIDRYSRILFLVASKQTSEFNEDQFELPNDSEQSVDKSTFERSKKTESTRSLIFDDLWGQIAIAIDRIFFLVYFIIFLIILFCIIISL